MDAMRDIQEEAAARFRGMKITIMGLGLLGRGVGDARYLASCGADLIITDLQVSQALQPSLRALAEYPHITFALGGHRFADFRGRDLIVKAAGVADDSLYLAEARAQGIPVRMSADLFAEISGMQIIGVTGTRGKTTTTYMLRAILEAAGVRSILGGNIPGISTLALLQEAHTANVAVLELDSWQLQGFGAAGMSPSIAVFTTFFSDHQAYYKRDMRRYLRDKANIFLNQSENDALVIGRQALPTLVAEYPDVAERAVIASVEDIAGWTVRIPGEHNRYNAACARAAARAFGIDDAIIRSVIENFAGVPGRLELVRESNGIRVYNDTTAVIPEATCAGLEALAPAPIVLIMGGSDKGSDTATLVASVKRHAKQVILLPGSGSDAIANQIPNVMRCQSLQEAIMLALQCAVFGDVILFSPAFSSRGTFANVFDRGARFNAILDALWAR